jgi:hypothetical protein
MRSGFQARLNGSVRHFVPCIHTGYTSSMTAVKIRDSIEKTLGVAILAGFFLGLFLLITVPMEMLKMAEVRGWPSRKGVITQAYASRVVSARRPDHWTAELRGTFHDNGETFRVARVRYGDFGFGDGKARSMATVAKYPVGSEVDIYYSPSHPGETILEPFAPWHTMIITLAVGIGLILVPILLFVLRKQLAHATP